MMPKYSNTFIQFQWTGLNGSGQKIQGTIEAQSLAWAKAKLRQQGVITQTISKKRATFWHKKIKAHDITLFSRQLATIIQAGVPLTQSLDLIASGAAHPRLSTLITGIKINIETGLTFAESLRKHPILFNDLMCSLIDMGEQSGTLETMLIRIATYKEKLEQLKQKIKKALTYPMAILLLACLITIGLLIFVVPQYQSLFDSFGANLPFITRVVIALSQFCLKYWLIMFTLSGCTLYAFLYGLKHAPYFAQIINTCLFKCPFIGSVLKKAAIARFARTLSITSAAGLPLLKALQAVEQATGNLLFAKATQKIQTEIANGQSLQQAMHSTRIFPSMVIQMIAIGEGSGTLEKMLRNVADFYENAVDNDMDTLSSLLEPILMAILGVLIGGLVVAMYLPIFKLGSMV